MTIAIQPQLTFKWTIERYHRAIEAGIFDDSTCQKRRMRGVACFKSKRSHAHNKTIPSMVLAYGDRSLYFWLRLISFFLLSAN
ncbi:MAG: hypothetical protein V7K25_30535 [Nostoc sp.]|uniref:hypothetical protein n=1 Tax=Nostoc sp. TaxID=1180 RepID=UPI002FF7EBB5